MNRSPIPTIDLLKDPSHLNGFDSLAIGYKSSSEGFELLLPSKTLREINNGLGLDLLELLELQGQEAIEKAKKNGSALEAKPGDLFVAPISSNHFGYSEIIFFASSSDKPSDVRKAGSALGRRLKSKKKRLLLATKVSPIFIESMLLSQYQWSEKSQKNSDQPSFFLLDGRVEDVERISTLISYLFLARDLIHTPANVKTPAWVASRITSIAGKLSRVKVVTKSGREIEKFGGLKAVGGSSTVHPPRFVTVSYSPPRAKAHVVLVGKGITFDTGGVSLKRPYDVMMAMKTDMSGAAVVAATALAAAELRIPVKVTALLMLAENTVSATAQRPSDVITHYGGTTVEVINTDAEGRLVLADGLAYADRHLDPDYLVDVATLTGAASLGLGKQYGAMYTRDQKLAKRLHDIGEVAGDRLWHMPLIDDYQVALRSEIADFNHTADKPKFGAGSVTAALFLEKFVGKRRWVHLDIAGPARSEVDAGEFVKGGTGFGVRTLVAWLESL